MSDVATYSDLFDVATAEALSQNSDLTLAKAQQEGTTLNALLSADAAVGDECIGQVERTQQKVFLDSAENKDLDRLVFDRYSFPRKSASPALASVKFSLPTANASAFAIPINTLLATQDGRQFITTAAATFPLGATVTSSIPVRSVLAGQSQQVGQNEITSIIQVPAGSPVGLTVTNQFASAGGTNDETDSELRNRARQFFTTVRRGTIGAIQAAALGIPGVTTATAFEVLDALGRPAKAVQLVVADTFTDQLASYGTTPAYQTQSQVLAQQVQDSLYDVRAAGIQVSVTIAQVVLQGIQLALTFEPGVDYEAVALQARARTVMFVNTLPPGAPFVRAQVSNVLRSVPGLIVAPGNTGVEVYSPPGNIVPLPLQAIRTSMELVIPIGIQPVGALQNSSSPDL